MNNNLDMISFVLFLFTALIFSPVLSQDSCDGKDYGTPGDFDFYIVSQSWSAEFCAASDHSSFPGCVNPTSWQQSNLTIHGAFQNYNVPRDGHDYPQCCQSTKYQLQRSDINPNLLSDLQLYWPNEQDPNGQKLSLSLWSHECNKHGSCSSYKDPGQFLQFVIDAVKSQASLQTPTYLTSNIGQSISIKKLQDYYQPVQVYFSCENNYLSEINSCWNKDLTQQMDCPDSVMNQPGMCQQDEITIRGFVQNLYESV